MEALEILLVYAHPASLVRLGYRVEAVPAILPSLFALATECMLCQPQRLHISWLQLFYSPQVRFSPLIGVNWTSSRESFRDSEAAETLVDIGLVDDALS